MIKALIVDDQKLIVKSLTNSLEQDPEIKVVGSARNGLEAIELCGSLKPDIVLMDVVIPECNGIEATKRIKSANREIKVLIVTMVKDEDDIRQALENGADGYILKDISPEELVKVTKNVCSGFEIISMQAYEVIRHCININSRNEAADAPKLLADLRLREDEMKLIRLIAAGQNNREIARVFYLSEGRIKNMVTNLLRKLNLKNRYELLSFVYKHKLF